MLLLVLCVNTGQCPVTGRPTISSNSENSACQVLSQGSLSYSCSINALSLIWISPVHVFSGSITVTTVQPVRQIPMPAPGVTLTEEHNNNSMCLNSTLTFTGSLTDLAQLNGGVISCNYTDLFAGPGDVVTIVVPGELVFWK